MAFIDDTLFDEEEGASPESPNVTGGTVGGPTAANLPGATSPGKTPGRFADLNEYLRVNEPQQFGQQLAGKIGEDVDKGAQTLTDVTSDFKGRVDSNTVRDTQGLIDQVGTNPEAIDVNAFSGLRDAQYQGPSNLAETADLYSRTQSAASVPVSKAKASESESGRFALLDSYFGRPSYSKGEKSLDNLLVQNDAGSQQAFDQMRQNAQQLSTQQKQTQQDLANYGATGKSETQATRQAARGALGIDDAGNYSGTGALGDTRGSVQSAYNDARAKYDASRTAFDNRDFASVGGDVTDIYNRTKDRNFGADLSRFVDFEQAPTEAGVASPEQLARMRALTALANMENPYETEGAGSDFGKDFFRVNEQGYSTEIANQQRAFNQLMDPVINQIRYLQSEIEFNKTNPGLKPAGVAKKNAMLMQQLQEQKKRMGELYKQFNVTGPDLAPETTGGNVIRTTFDSAI